MSNLNFRRCFVAPALSHLILLITPPASATSSLSPILVPVLSPVPVHQHVIVPLAPTGPSQSSSPPLPPSLVELNDVALSSHLEPECRQVRLSQDKCAFVRAHCQDDEAGLIRYLTFYFCTLSNLQPLALAILVVWLVILFSTIGIASSDFFTVNLGAIASILGLSESLAGVTFLAFGNGSPDVFSTFAAMNSHSGGMAVGELIGAAGFITGVVAGSMALPREFKVSRFSFIRDLIFFVVAATATFAFIADEDLALWECLVMIGFYIFYVIVVVGWHWLSTRRKRRRQRDAAARAHVYTHAPAAHQELEPYRDSDNDTNGDGGDSIVGHNRSRNMSAAASPILREVSPRIEIEGPDSVVSEAVDDDDKDKDDDDSGSHEHARQEAAEVTSSMRVHRPRCRRSSTIIAPIRPSLIGALEFRSVLASLEKERNMMNYPTNRAHRAILQSASALTGILPPLTPTTTSRPESVCQLDDSLATGRWALHLRERALSSGHTPYYLPDALPHAPSSSWESPMNQSSARNASPLSPTTVIDGYLAPPAPSSSLMPPAPQLTTACDAEEGNREHDTAPSASPPVPDLHAGLRLEIPRTKPFPQHTREPSPTLSTFPDLTDESANQLTLLLSTPQAAATAVTATGQSAHLPVLSISVAGADDGVVPERLKSRCWPNSVLPAPDVLGSTLFPTMQGWWNKGFWEKMVSLMSVPSIFLLVITLPVVELENQDDDDANADEIEIDAAPGPGALEMGAAAGAPSPSSARRESQPRLPPCTGPQADWQEYRRRARSIHANAPNTSFPSTPLSSIPSTRPTSQIGGQSVTPTPPTDALLTIPPLHASHPAPPPASLSLPPPTPWNRWLLALQAFTGPLLVVTVVWLNFREGLDQPGRMLVRLVLYSLVCSLTMLAVLLWTSTAYEKPRYQLVLCLFGFVISITWISTLAGEVVGVLKALGVILGISEAILGLTVFAIGNSLGDLVSNVTVARLGYPVMALSACFGGPMLNILLGIGLGGAWMSFKSAKEDHARHPDRPIKYEPFQMHLGGTLLISGLSLLITLVILLVTVPLNKWRMNRKIGLVLIGVWSVSTTVNLVGELTGAWSDFA